MKHLLVLLLALAAAACDPKRESPGETPAPQARRATHAERPSAPPSTVPPPLLKTSRITVSFSGTGFAHAVIQDAAQADAILTDVRTLPPSAGRDRVTSGILSALAKVDPKAARTRLAAWNGGLISEWLNAAKAVAEQLGKTDPEAAAAFIEDSVPRASQAVVWREFLPKLPLESRLSFLDRIPESTTKNTMVGELVASWFEADPQACAAWLDGHSAAWSAEEIACLSAPLWNATNTKNGPGPWLAAFRAAKGEEVRRLFANAAWSHSDVSQRAELMPELQGILPDHEDREWEEIIEANPAGYAHALSTAQITALSAEDMGKLISSWAKTNPQAAIDWAMEHQRPEAARGLLSLYYQEPKSALALASKLPPGNPRDQAVGSLCQSLAHDVDQASADALLPLISDADFRERIRREVHGDWK